MHQVILVITVIGSKYNLKSLNLRQAALNGFRVNAAAQLYSLDNSLERSVIGSSKQLAGLSCILLKVCRVLLYNRSVAAFYVLTYAIPAFQPFRLTQVDVLLYGYAGGGCLLYTSPSPRDCS